MSQDSDDPTNMHLIKRICYWKSGATLTHSYPFIDTLESNRFNLEQSKAPSEVAREHWFYERATRTVAYSKALHEAINTEEKNDMKSEEIINDVEVQNIDKSWCINKGWLEVVGYHDEYVNNCKQLIPLLSESQLYMLRSIPFRTSPTYLSNRNLYVWECTIDDYFVAGVEVNEEGTSESDEILEKKNNKWSWKKSKKRSKYKQSNGGSNYNKDNHTKSARARRLSYINVLQKKNDNLYFFFCNKNK